ncbi:MAG TPA: hypothetical protein VID68_10440 [Solirubrobacteraceae bacterium]
MLRRSARVLVALLAVAWSIAGADVAFAGYPNSVDGALADCGAGHDPLVGHYSVAVLHKALRQLNTNSLQYTTCSDALTQALRADLLPKRRPRSRPRSNKPVTKPSGPVVKPTPSAIRRRVHEIQNWGGGRITLPTGATVTPGTVTARSAGFLSNLPTPLLVVLAALLAAVVAVAGRALQTVVRARRTR